jgi:hypothetical protein
MAQFIQQGDVVLLPLTKAPNITAMPEVEAVMAYGEATGHSHRVVGDRVRFFRNETNAFLLIEGNGATLVHEEHGSHFLDPGWYERRIQREKTLEEAGWRKVVD